MMHWFINGCGIEKFPDRQKDKKEFSGLLVIKSDKTILKYEYTPHPTILPPQQIAIGSGRDFGMAAMYLGKTAVEAVEIAIKFDIYSGDDNRLLLGE